MPQCKDCIHHYVDPNKEPCAYCVNYMKFELMPETALNVQEGGQHYKSKAIQPIVYIHANNLGFCEGNVVKYITRHKEKNGIEDLKKAKHYIDLLIELEYKNE